MHVQKVKLTDDCLRYIIEYLKPIHIQQFSIAFECRQLLTNNILAQVCANSDSILYYVKRMVECDKKDLAFSVIKKYEKYIYIELDTGYPYGVTNVDNVDSKDYMKSLLVNCIESNNYDVFTQLFYHRLPYYVEFNNYVGSVYKCNGPYSMYNVRIECYKCESYIRKRDMHKHILASHYNKVKF